MAWPVFFGAGIAKIISDINKNAVLPISQRTLSEKGKLFIHSFEACSSLVKGENKYTRSILPDNTKIYAYRDSKQIPTIGFGSTYINGRKVNMNDVITYKQAKELSDLHYKNEVHNVLVKRFPNLKLTQSEYDALCSFSYNFGAYFNFSSIKSAISSAIANPSLYNRIKIFQSFMNFENKKRRYSEVQLALNANYTPNV